MSVGISSKYFLGILNTQAPIKRNLPRANRVPHMRKGLRKTMRKRSGLEKIHRK